MQSTNKRRWSIMILMKGIQQDGSRAMEFIDSFKNRALEAGVVFADVRDVKLQSRLILWAISKLTNSHLHCELFYIQRMVK